MLILQIIKKLPEKHSSNT